MKKKILFGALALAGLALASCSGSKDEVKTIDVYTINDQSEVGKHGDFPILFKKNSSIPYISLEDGAKLLSMVRTVNLDDAKYNVKYEKSGNDYVLSNETGAKCVINVQNQTLTYDDYDKFTYVVTEAQKPLSIVPIKKSMKALKYESGEYTAGKSVTFDLKPYSKLDIYEYEGKGYLPLSVFNTAFFGAGESISLAYNTKYLFVIPAGSLSSDILGIPVETALGTKFREGVASSEVSEEMSEYNYQSICFDFNTEYGLKNKFETFEKFAEGIGYKSDILSTNPKKIDEAIATTLTWLNDGHTALTEFSNLYEFGDNKVDKAKTNPIKDLWYENNEAFNKKKKAVIKDGIEYKDDTVFVTFSNFTNISNELLYDFKIDNTDDLDDFTGEDDLPGLDFGDNPFDFDASSNTAYLFNKLYKDLTSDQYKNTIKNVVIDLTSNDGGAADGLLYAVSTLVGDVAMDVTNPLTGARCHQVYKADINADGVVDNKDKSLSEHGFKIYFLNSAYSFSSANAMPILAKQNKANVVMLGDKTAGGPCAVRSYVTPIGSVISSSSLNTISKLENNQYVNIDDGIEADHKLTEDQMIDRNYIVSCLKNW